MHQCVPAVLQFTFSINVSPHNYCTPPKPGLFLSLMTFVCFGFIDSFGDFNWLLNPKPIGFGCSHRLFLEHTVLSLSKCVRVR